MLKSQENTNFKPFFRKGKKKKVDFFPKKHFFIGLTRRKKAHSSQTCQKYWNKQNFLLQFAQFSNAWIT